jgi:hypothetical protein
LYFIFQSKHFLFAKPDVRPFSGYFGKKTFTKLGNSRRETFKIGKKIIGQITNMGIYETVKW